MATPINAPLTREIWNLSIDDLLAPLPESARLGGSGPFVINLSASTAPISLPIERIAGCEHAHVYQVQRTEDRRVRYRLRLGPFASEDEAVAILEKVRDIYPSALTATADADDLRAIATKQARTDALLSHAENRIKKMAAPTAILPPLAAAEQMVPVRVPAALPSLETTQTVRALTALELIDDETLPWYVIQLSVAEDAFDPDTVPNLDIFTVYRLYSVARLDQGRVMHSLRVGFFGEEVAADAVASYLAAYYDKPTVERVSVAERERFADQRLEPRKDVGATGKHAVIEITSERFVRERRSTVRA
jgi:SPOR domain